LAVAGIYCNGDGEFSVVGREAVEVVFVECGVLSGVAAGDGCDFGELAVG